MCHFVGFLHIGSHNYVHSFAYFVLIFYYDCCNDPTYCVYICIGYSTLLALCLCICKINYNAIMYTWLEAVSLLITKHVVYTDSSYRVIKGSLQ